MPDADPPEAAVQVIPAVQINLLLLQHNAHEVSDIIGYARRTRERTHSTD
jgi:hypothetical protein